MKKFMLSLALLCGGVMGMQAQLLYKVSKDSTDQKPSYVMASCRLINPMGTVSQMGSVKEAMKQTEQMFFEVNKSAYADVLKSAKTLEGGKKLLDLLTPAQKTKLNAFLKKYMEVDFRSPYVQRKYGTIVPAALQEDLEQLLFVANHMGEYDPTHTFDQYFEAQAKVNNETVGGLSDADSYIAATYKADLQKQVDRLMSFVENEATELKKLDKEVAHFNAQDLDALAQVAEPTVSADTMGAWAAKVEEVMGQKPTLFVVDAANMGGEKGLLKALRDKGLTVEGVR